MYAMFSHFHVRKPNILWNVVVAVEQHFSEYACPLNCKMIHLLIWDAVFLDICPLSLTFGEIYNARLWINIASYQIYSTKAV